MTLFQAFYQDMKLTVMNDHVIKISYNDKLEDEPLDYQAIRHLILTDFEEDLSIIELNDKSHKYLDEAQIARFIQTLPYQSYDIASLIKQMIIRNDDALKAIRKKLVNTLGQDMIDTTLALAEHNMNVSIASKHLYLHRNTMHYRIDKIIEKTGINIKQFDGLAIFYYLFG